MVGEREREREREREIYVFSIRELLYLLMCIFKMN